VRLVVEAVVNHWVTDLVSKPVMEDVVICRLDFQGVLDRQFVLAYVQAASERRDDHSALGVGRRDHPALLVLDDLFLNHLLDLLNGRSFFLHLGNH